MERNGGEYTHTHIYNYTFTISITFTVPFNLLRLCVALRSKSNFMSCLSCVSSSLPSMTATTVLFFWLLVHSFAMASNFSASRHWWCSTWALLFISTHPPTFLPRPSNIYSRFSYTLFSRGWGYVPYTSPPCTPSPLLCAWTPYPCVLSADGVISQVNGKGEKQL